MSILESWWRGSLQLHITYDVKPRLDTLTKVVMHWYAVIVSHTARDLGLGDGSGSSIACSWDWVLLKWLLFAVMGLRL